MTRRTVLRTLAGAAAVPLIRGESADAPPRNWTLAYFYDRNQETFTINDFRFVTAQFGMAVGWIAEKKGKPKPMAVVTRDGGNKWDLQPLPDVGISVFFLNDSLGWLVGEKSLWRSDEGGREWKKQKLPKDTDVNRVYFINADRGWAVCTHKTVLETKDGGRSWTPLAAASQPGTNPDYTSYNWIEFLDSKQGVIVGSSTPPRPGDDQPAWLDPQGAAQRREWPTVTVSLETRDSGATWTPQTASAFGRATRFRPTSDGSALLLIRFINAFEWPSEVYVVKSGTQARAFREKDRLVTDCGWLAPGRALLAAIEPPGRLPQLPIPGKLHMLASDDLTHWTEMKVDYRAFGTRAMLSILNSELAWVATDTGQILRLTA